MSNLNFASAQQDVPRSTSGLAILSLLLGFTSFVFCLLTGIPAVVFAFLAWRQIDQSGGRIRGRGLATTGLVLGGIGTMATVIMPALLLPAISAAREAARHNMSVNQLRHIGLGLHNFESARGGLPLAGIDGPITAELQDASDPSGPAKGTQLSWRVHLLPFVGEQSLYNEFHLDEPWDSPHNRKLISRMPDFYESPRFQDGAEGETVYLAVVGSDAQSPFRTALHPTERRRFSDYTDGLSETILIVEADADQAVVWTRPADLQFNVRQPRRGLGNLRPREFLALMADGSTQRITDSVDDETLTSLILIDDSRKINLRDTAP